VKRRTARRSPVAQLRDLAGVPALPVRTASTTVAFMASKEDHYDRAVDCIADGDQEGAVAAYREALALDPDYADALEGLSMVLADLGQFEEAIAAAERVVALVPDEILSYTNVSRICQKAGDVPKAEEWAAKARMLDWKQQLKS
jgi:tetratricopeptide (TPR) repeat protein